MGNILSGSEIVEIGIRIEKNGRDFYNILAGQSKTPSAAKVFKYLSGEEEKHIAVFEGILDKAHKYEPQGLDADQYFAYMDALAGENVFTRQGKGEELAKKIKSDKQAIDKGIGFEKDSIVFYEGIKKVVPDYDSGIVDVLIAQEKNHLKQLIDLKSSI